MRELASNFLKIYYVIPASKKLYFWLIVALSIVQSVFDLVGLASVMPLMSLLLFPSSINHSSIINFINNWAPFAYSPTVHIVGLYFVSFLFISTTISVIFQYFTIFFSADVSVELSRSIANSYFFGNQSFDTRISPATHSSFMCNDTSRFCFGGVMQLMFILARSVQVLLLSMFLFFSSKYYAFYVVLFLIITYICIFLFMGSRMYKYGSSYIQSFSLAQHFSSEMYSSYREIIISGKASVFIAKICGLLSNSLRSEAYERFLPNIPKYVLEFVAVVVIFSFPILRSYRGEDPKIDLPIIMTFAFAAFKIMPAMQQLYSSVNIIKFYAPMANKLLSAINQQDIIQDNPHQIEAVPTMISLDNISYLYKGSKYPAIKNVCFNFSKGSKIAIVGQSGAGKSTLVDIILGFIYPTSGLIKFDDVAINQRLMWNPKLLGYVPQKPFIVTDTIDRNIAFGIDHNKVDLKLCEAAARKANIYEVIMKFPKNFKTELGVGEFGLSGGEIQRIALARALYHDPDLLILDEPTSALDPINAKLLFECFDNIGPNKSIIVITHNLNYLNKFDKIVLLDQGEVIVVGSYNDIQNNVNFGKFFRDNAACL